MISGFAPSTTWGEWRKLRNGSAPAQRGTICSAWIKPMTQNASPQRARLPIVSVIGEILINRLSQIGTLSDEDKAALR